ncbi:MAG: hypothetical protein OEY49_00295 [Candidatus Heimdallarchaeota archaeon]|nr:hypothetical protein [Candidatus Heimdallarchaeota archaeon]
MKVGFVQFEPMFGLVRENVEKSCELIRSANADLLVLPELCNTGYSFLSWEEIEQLTEFVFPNNVAGCGNSIQTWMNVSI